MEPKSKPLPLTTLKDRLKQMMERHVFVVRNKEGLTQVLREIDAIEGDIARLQVPRFSRFNLEWARAIEFPYVVEAARIVARSALVREESRGFHYRSDFPTGGQRALAAPYNGATRPGEVVLIGSAPVALDHMRPEV